ncbi:hypothetical protein JQS43_21360 [Natronosporangium hydrolyticum]|uniref:DUF2231 domain-containing protein n=1 Tax=Natronosporangium hydrolyticum TaxID=2811111 RepID=A0A895YJT5_9ACTN|nr:DUF2231 domain-containing protein [Natronosporangium hydrolyticum]QSB14058.1 hypothetical protein JQS43_21360 [Natronosporangium hydrolyticum]
MFEGFQGLPLHALAVHLPVVLIPALAVMAAVYALLPRVRALVGWLVVALAVVAPLSAVVAKLSGDAYRDVMFGTAELDPDLPVQAHAGFGVLSMWSSLGLGAATLVLAAVRRGTESGSGLWRWVAWLLSAIVLVLAAVAVYYLIRVGHTGSEMSHGGRLPD